MAVLRDNDAVLEYIKNAENKVESSIRTHERGVEYWTDLYTKDTADLEELIKKFNKTVKKVKTDQRNLESAKKLIERLNGDLYILYTLKLAYLSTLDAEEK